MTPTLGLGSVAYPRETRVGCHVPHVAHVPHVGRQYLIKVPDT